VEDLLMVGRRVPDETPLTDYQSGDYGRTDGVWHTRPPRNAQGDSYVGSVGRHTVTEHADGTITVSPSILQRWGDGEEIWHGYLERGIWRSC